MNCEREQRKSRLRESNPEPPVYKTGALPIELRRRWVGQEAKGEQSGIVMHIVWPFVGSASADSLLNDLQNLKLHRPARGSNLNRFADP